MKQRIISGIEARKLLILSILKIAKIVESSYGPIGRKTLLDSSEAPNPFLTNDGFSILSNIVPNDSIETLAKKLLWNAAHETNSLVGDGTTTTVILTSRLTINLLRLIDEDNINPIDINNQLDIFLENAKKHIISVSKKASSLKDLEKIAFISCRDKKLAKIIAKFCKATGKDAQRILESNNKPQIDTEVIQDGFTIETDVLDPIFYQDQKLLETTLSNPAILLSTREIDSNEELTSAVVHAQKLGYSSLVVLCNNMKGAAFQTCKTIAGDKNKNFKIIPLKAPKSLEKQVTLLEDIAVLTGARLINHSKGESLYNVYPEDLGSCEMLKFNPHKATILRGRKDETKVADRLAQVNTFIANEDYGSATSFLFERKRILVSKLGILKIGATTTLEATDIYTRAEDAIKNVQSVWVDGLVEGGGFTLAKYAYSQNQLIEAGSDFEIINKTIYDTLNIPLELLIELTNSKKYEQGIMNLLLTDKSGFDFRKQEFVDDLIEAGISHSTKAILFSLQTAVSIAKSIIFVENLIIEETI